MLIWVVTLYCRLIGRLAMMGWDWRLRTAPSTGLLFISGWFAMWNMVWWYWQMLTPNLSNRALWEPPVLADGPVSRDISGASGRMGEVNENLVYPSPWDFKRSFTCLKINGMGPPALLPIRRNVCCGYLSPLEIHRLDRVRTRNLWVQWQAHYLTKTIRYVDLLTFKIHP
jgi:hypothetical protein